MLQPLLNLELPTYDETENDSLELRNERLDPFIVKASTFSLP
jgi:hypothetical protein